MKAVILVGGKATRLEPLTCNTPKAMVPVLNRPFLEHVIRHLSRHRITDIVLAQGHLAQPMESFLGDGRQFGVRLSYVVEDSPRGTAGAIKNAEKYLDRTFLVLNGDIFSALNIAEVVDFHRSKEAIATIVLTGVADPTSYGVVETDAGNRVTRFLEKPEKGEVTASMINAGVYILEPDVLARIPAQTKVSIERETFPQLIAGGLPVYAYPSSGYWMDVGTPEKYLQLHHDLLAGKCSECAANTGEGGLVAGKSHLHNTAQLSGPVVLGEGCSIGPRVKLIGPVVIGEGSTILTDSIIAGSVIWRQARIGPGVYLKDSILADNCRLDEGSSGEGVVLGDNVTVASHHKLESGSRIRPGTTVGRETL